MGIKENSLQAEISQLQELCKRMEDMEINDSKFNEPATEDEMLDWENKNGIAIPESYKEWLRFSNGARLMGYTADLLSVNRMVINGQHVPEDVVIIGHLIGDGEMLCFSKTTGKIVRILDGRMREFNSFKEILLELIEMGQSEFGEDEKTNEIGAKMLAMLEAQRNLLGKLPDEQAKILAMFEERRNQRGK